MPRYVRRRKYARKRPNRRYRKRYYRNNRLRKPYNRLSNTPLPIKFATKLKYSEAFSINPAIANAGVYSFLANDLYQPNLMTTAHQPYGFDQIMAMYDHFTVVGAKITFRVSVPANNDQPFHFYVHTSDTTTMTQVNNVTAMMEQPRTNRKTVSKPSAASGKELQITQKFSAKKFFGLSKIVGDASYRGDAGSRPTEQAFFHCCIAPMDATSDLAAYTCIADIEYTAVFTEPRVLVQS